MNNPIVIDLSQGVPAAGLNASDAYASGLAIQNQANGIIANGGSYSDANNLATSAVRNLLSQGVNSPYYTPANAAQGAPTSLWQNAGTYAGAILDAMGNPLATAHSVAPAVAPTIKKAITPNWLKDLTFARVAVVVVGWLMIVGSMMMFATDKSNVMTLVTSAAKEPELLA